MCIHENGNRSLSNIHRSSYNHHSYCNFQNVCSLYYPVLRLYLRRLRLFSRSFEFDLTKLNRHRNSTIKTVYPGLFPRRLIIWRSWSPVSRSDFPYEMILPEKQMYFANCSDPLIVRLAIDCKNSLTGTQVFTGYINAIWSASIFLRY